MRTLIITAGNGKRFSELRNFVVSLRGHGSYDGAIAVCDNEIGGTWNNPGTWRADKSFDAEQSSFFSSHAVEVYPLPELLARSSVPEETIRAIRSPTQRYPYKFLYNTLISRLYLGKVDVILYFDSDIYFQRPIAPLLAEVTGDQLLIVKEWRKMKEGPYLPNWLAFSDFSKLSSQDDYLATMLNADNFCSGFFGGKASSFHRFNLMCLLLASNRFVDFYSDQPLVNIMKTFFGYPFKEIDFRFCLHLGELEPRQYDVADGAFRYQGVVPISVHFNGGKYVELESVLKSGKALPPPTRTLKQQLRLLLTRLRRARW